MYLPDWLIQEQKSDKESWTLDSFGYIANYIMEAYDKLAQFGLASCHRCKLAKCVVY